MRIYCEMITTIRLDNTHHLIQLKKIFFLVMRTFRINSLTSFQIYHTVMLIRASLMVEMVKNLPAMQKILIRCELISRLHITPPVFIYYWEFVPFDHLHPIYAPLSTSGDHKYVVSEVFFSRVHI